MDIPEFKNLLNRIKQATSITGKHYHSIHFINDKIKFTRQGKNESESILISELYNFYKNENNFNTSIAKKYISGRVQSPSVAILNELNKNKERASSKGTSINNVKNKVESKKLTDEKKFFEAFSKIIGSKFLFSKNIDKPTSSNQIFLSSYFPEYKFSDEIIQVYNEILSKLNSTNTFKSNSLSHLIDGLIIEHPIFGNRIVEFDEEQHFTPARLETLNILKNSVKLPYLDIYIEICNDLNYLNTAVLNKHRISFKLDKYPTTFKNFLEWLNNQEIKESGYIEGKNGFDFKGGRIAQRAYYDSLRDTAHLSPKNEFFNFPLRFPKRLFELKTNLSFSMIKDEDVKSIIKEILKEVYNLP